MKQELAVRSESCSMLVAHRHPFNASCGHEPRVQLYHMLQSQVKPLDHSEHSVCYPGCNCAGCIYIIVSVMEHSEQLKLVSIGPGKDRVRITQSSSRARQTERLGFYTRRYRAEWSFTECARHQLFSQLLLTINESQARY